VTINTLVSTLTEKQLHSSHSLKTLESKLPPLSTMHTATMYTAITANVCNFHEN